MFLQLKKAFHMDKPVIIELLGGTLDTIADRNKYDKMEYKAKARNRGENYPVKEDGGYLIRTNQDFDFVMSEALYKHISLYDKGAIIKVTMKSTVDQSNKAGFVWEVQPTKKIKQPDTFRPNNDLAIKWGMAFNNATKLVSNIKTTDSVSFIEDKVKMIEEIMPDMFKIACSMPEEPTKEKEDDDDLPF